MSRQGLLIRGWGVRKGGGGADAEKGVDEKRMADLLLSSFSLTLK